MTPRSRPTIRRTSSVWLRTRRERGGDGAALAHDGDPVGDREHLLEPMRDEDDRASRALRARDDVEQPLDLAGAQRSGRLVENDEIGVERQRLGDLDELALRRGEVAHLGVERQRVLLPEIGENLAGAAPHGGRDSRPGRPSSGRKIFSSDRKIGRETGLLHHHRDAGVKRLARAAQVERLRLDR